MKKLGVKGLILLLVVGAAALAVSASAVASRKTSYQVCVLLPDTQSSVRWAAVRRTRC